MVAMKRPMLRPRTAALAAILIVIAGALSLVLVRYVSLAHSRADSWIPARTVPDTDVNPYGANFFLSREVEEWKRQRTVEMAREAGLGWAKQQFAWAEIEPLRKGEFVDPVSGESSWAKFDRLVDLLRANGLQVIARLDLAPAWARPPDSRAEAPPEDFADFGDFVYAFVDHFRGRVQYIQIWNEPNIYPEWGEQAVDPAAYTHMLQVAYTRAKEADPNVYILSAPLAITLGEPHPQPGRWRSMPDLGFLSAMYEAGAGSHFDILSANAFGFDLPPEDPPGINVLNFRRVELQREIMEQNGDEGKAIWFNEYGWNAAPPSFSDEALVWKRVGEREQAEYTLRGIDFARREWPWAGVFNVWYFRQTGQQYSPDDAAFYFRMVDVDFTPRLVYDAVSDATASLFVAPAGHFEETNPAVAPGADWQGAIAPEASGGAFLECQVPGASLTFAFRGRSVDLIARRGPEGGRLLVTVDGHNVAGLPVEAQGRSYLELDAPTTEWQARLPVASGLSTGQHVLRLTVAEDSPAGCNVDAFEVNAGQPPAFPLVPVAGLGLGLVAAAAGLAWDLRSRRRPKFF
jgi:polysaccharide biosynthesis protein PslG